MSDTYHPVPQIAGMAPSEYCTQGSSLGYSSTVSRIEGRPVRLICHMGPHSCRSRCIPHRCPLIPLLMKHQYVRGFRLFLRRTGEKACVDYGWPAGA